MKVSIKQLNEWHDRSQYKRIINAITSMPEDAKGFAYIMHLTRAYANLGNYQTAYDLLVAYNKEGANDALWNWRFGLCLYETGRQIESVPYLERAIALGDDYTETLKYFRLAQLYALLHGKLDVKRQRALWPASVADDMCAIVLRLTEYTYDSSSYRRSYRSTDPNDYCDRLESLGEDISFDWDKFDLLTYLKMSDAQINKEHYKSPDTWTVSMLIALKIDRGDKAVLGAVTDVILSDNNARAVSYELIRGVAMSHNTELHELMAKLLLAAKLQEGLRQAILETADDGTIDYLKLMIKTVLENDLLRYSSALRAVCVWMGLGYDYSDKRAIEKLLKLGFTYLENETERKAAIGSADVVQMYAGMWAESVFSIQNLNAHIERYMRGEKYQKMVGAYFLDEAGSKENSIRLAGDALGETDMDTLTLILENYRLRLYDVADNYWGTDKEKVIKLNGYPECLKDKATRNQHFACLAEIIEKIPKDGHTLNGKPFDWCLYSLTRGAVYETMMVLAAYDFDTAKQHQLMELYQLAESQNKVNFLGFFIAREIRSGNFQDESRDFLFGCLSDKSMPVRVCAAKLLKRLTLDEAEIVKAEELLALKTGEIRQTVLEVIRSAGDDAVLSSIKRLIADKSDNKRLAALDLLASAKKSGKVSDEVMQEFFAAMPKTTEAETILINNLTDASLPEYTPENGFGLYDPAYFPQLPPVERDGQYDLKAFRSITAKDMMKVFDTLISLIEKYKDYEYKVVFDYGGAEDRIFGEQNYLNRIAPYGENREERIEDYVLGDVWRGWFEKHSADLPTLLKIYYADEVSDWDGDYELAYKPFARDLIKKYLSYDEIKSFLAQENSKKYDALAKNIIRTLLGNVAENSERFAICYGVLADFYLTVPKEDWAKLSEADDDDDFYSNEGNKLVDSNELTVFISQLKASGNDEYSKKLALCYAIGAASGCRYAGLDISDIAYAAANGIVEKSELNRAVMEIDGSKIIGAYTSPSLYQYAKETAAKYPVLMECVGEVANRVIEIELKRGDTKTPVSKLAKAIERHEGAKVFADILVALGKETLARGYIYGSDYTKREVLSSLLKASVPAKDDNADTLKAALRDRVTEKRLLEAAMYAPAWIAIVQDVLGWDGLKSAAWYFHAHTRNSYSSEFETEVARFSPIDKEDFQRGAFDIGWFKEAHETLGQERFDILYDCAKYISDGAAHRRAQLFADAALGKLSIDELEPQIRDKRNKDLLLSYSLMPFSKDKTREALRRYEFINEFLKAGREFGAQRQASEKEAANIALENLARNLGYADVLRFNWKMEMEKLDTIQDYFKPHTVRDVELFLEMTDSGLAELIIGKGGKQLKSVPATIKKDNYVQEINAVKASLKAQSARARQSLEKAMENRDTFTFAEVSELMGHPVISPIIKKLVFRSGDELGFLSDTGLTSADGSPVTLKKDAALIIAHCYDLFTLGKWLDYQRYVFDNSLIQPFKQIFRELYTVNEDEKSEKTVSRRYAGNQIQPKKTVALLKGRGWTVDYESGLQKVYYKENVVASMYALADWFSPSDMEAPTLETVQFRDRKTGKPLDMTAINSILFSEVMRDVDLVVSVAHVGGVDPMTSHSTMEMRAAIVTESARLLKLTNVTMGDHHAKIKGALGEYSVHLGSGQAHMMGRGALSILPVHSQQRGRLFLPFMDEDPKTAEIVAKVLLLAKDSEIKDPTVMMQIKG